MSLLITLGYPSHLERPDELGSPEPPSPAGDSRAHDPPESPQEDP